jgi:hypothetical protein
LVFTASLVIQASSSGLGVIRNMNLQATINEAIASAMANAMANR